MQVVQQLTTVDAAQAAGGMDSTRGGQHSMAGMDASENQTCQQRQQHVTDQLGNLSMHAGECRLHAQLALCVNALL